MNYFNYLLIVCVFLNSPFSKASLLKTKLISGSTIQLFFAETCSDKSWNKFIDLSQKYNLATTTYKISELEFTIQGMVDNKSKSTFQIKENHFLFQYHKRNYSSLDPCEIYIELERDSSIKTNVFQAFENKSYAEDLVKEPKVLTYLLQLLLEPPQLLSVTAGITTLGCGISIGYFINNNLLALNSKIIFEKILKQTFSTFLF